jgi:hypothetical protein
VPRAKLRGKQGFAGQLQSDGTTPSTLTLLKGQTNPVRGWLFPHYRKKVPRTTAEFTTHGQDVNELAMFSLRDDPPLTAALGGRDRRSRAAVVFRERGVRLARVDVQRSGHRLRVTSHP